MNKKSVTSEVTEDLKIRDVAYQKNSMHILLLIILIILFTLTFFCTLFYIGKYYDAKILDNGKIIEIKAKHYNVLIKDNGDIKKTILEDDTLYNKEIKLENVSTLNFKADKGYSKENSIKFNVKYDIEKNEFENKTIASTNNDVLVRFMYSYDNENWEYINNVISTPESTLTPLMGSYYDISGLTTTLNVATNFEIKSTNNDSSIIYWKCETLLKNIENNIGKSIEAKFKIEYQDN